MEDIKKVSDIKLTDIIDLDFLQKFQDDFAEGVGVASVTVDLEGNPITKPSRYTRFCEALTQSTLEGDKRCAMSHRFGGEEAAKTGKPYIYECHAGLLDFAVPIMLDDKLIGTILGGQVLLNTPESDKYRNIAEEIGVDPEAYVTAVKEVKTLSKKQIEAAANVLWIVTNNISKSWFEQLKLKNMSTSLDDGITQIAATMQEMSASASEINNSQTILNEEIQKVNHLTEQINEVISLITDIADETRLLGLNAAIEATRAGAAGLGFGVVAQEIRKLSADSKETVNKIKEFTSHIMESVSKTVRMGELTKSATHEQTSGMEAMNVSIEDIAILSQSLNKLASLK